MDDGLEFTKDILSVLIPSVLTLLTAIFISNRWQNKKEASEIKRGILTDYELGLKREINLQIMLVQKIKKHYIIWSKTGILKNEDIVLPTDNKCLPKIVFATDFLIFNKKFEKALLHSSKFLSSLRFYYRNDKLEKLYRDLEGQISLMFFIIHDIFNTTDNDVFKQAVERFDILSTNNIKEIGNFEKLLVKQKMIISTN